MHPLFHRPPPGGTAMAESTPRLRLVPRQPHRATPASEDNGGAQQEALALACRTLWIATLALMSAYLHAHEPRQRQALARHIARNFDTLERESDAFAPACREAFARMARHWANAARPDARPAAQGS